MEIEYSNSKNIEKMEFNFMHMFVQKTKNTTKYEGFFKNLGREFMVQTKNLLLESLPNFF
jgi:hypothetical protein